MKKVISICLCAALCLLLAACGGEKGGTAVQTNESDTPGTTAAEAGGKDGYTPDADLPGTLTVNEENVQYSVDAPSTSIHNFGTMVVNMGDYYALYHHYLPKSSKLLYDVDIDTITNASHVIAGMSKQFVASCKNALIPAEGYEYTVTEQKNVEINGFDMCRFTGKFTLLYDTPDPAVDYTETTFVGYSLIKDGCPVYFVVVDNPVEGNADIGKMADKIAKTFREYSKD